MSARQYTALVFVTDEPVTPDILAERVARACAAGGALRPGEGILCPSDPQLILQVDPRPAGNLADILPLRPRPA